MEACKQSKKCRNMHAQYKEFREEVKDGKTEVQKDNPRAYEEETYQRQ